VISSAPCPAGSHLSDRTCTLCPVGQYTDQSGQLKCEKCPQGRTTAGKGSTSEDQCIGKLVYMCVSQCDHDVRCV